jgi:hypothetical protein
MKEDPMAWTWRVETAGGEPVDLESDVPEFPSQSDAESWLGEVWRDLADAGAGQATLMEHDREVYGPMSLSAE